MSNKILDKKEIETFVKKIIVTAENAANNIDDKTAKQRINEASDNAVDSLYSFIRRTDLK